MSDQRRARAARIVDALTEHHLDALLVTGRANIRYLTGFSGSSALLLVTARDLVLITDFRYQTQVGDEVGDAARVRVEGVSLWEGLWHELSQLAGRAVIGFDSAHVTHRDFQRFLDEATGARWQWRPQGDIVERLRESKDAGELALITAAAGIATRALSYTLNQVRAGLTELEVAGMLEKALRDQGSEAHPFEAIVASGPRSALPHARATTRTIESGEFLLLDFGAEHGGYCSDVTRTVVVGRAADEQRAVYDIVRTANERASAAIRAGMTGGAADALARDYIAAAGFGDEFGH
ncbi:MAG TPA: Xaa-Pro peptidase family protein, partial [Candidatus Elarobacter sp.]|nr:Xaa-Pro peptidase family protein [Candidatus Elarobacter sp.]